jgi:hypothetical protein
MEFDEGQLLGQATNGGGEKKVKMICGIHMEEEQMEKHNNGQTMEAQTAMDPNIIDKDKVKLLWFSAAALTKILLPLILSECQNAK